MNFKNTIRNKISKKLRSKEGSSVLFALLLLMVVVMVSVVVVTASTTSAKTLRTDKSEQQAYLTVSSAAQLLRDSICEDANKFTVVTVEKQAATGAWNLQSVSLTDPLPSGTLSYYINKGLELVTDPEKAGAVYEVSLALDDKDENLETTSVNMYMTAASLDGSNTNYVYAITAELSLEDVSDVNNCFMKMTVETQPGSPKATVNGNIRTTTITYTWNSENAVIE